MSQEYGIIVETMRVVRLVESNCALLWRIMNNYKLEFDKTIMVWDEGLPLGNGDLGCLIWNKSNHLRFSIDKSGIWDCSDSPERQEDFSYENIKQLVAQGKQRALAKKYDKCYDNPTPTKLPTGKLIIDLKVDENVQSGLDLNTAEAALNVSDIKVASFVHATSNYGMIKVSKSDIDIQISNPQFGQKKPSFFSKMKVGIDQSLKNICYKPAQFFEKTVGEIAIKYFLQNTNDACYGIVIAIKKYVDKTEIAYTVGVGVSDEWVQNSVNIVTEAVKSGYDNAILSHKTWWSDYWNKSDITLPRKDLEKNWYLGQYLLACCSRKGHYPMPLQGVWTADNNQLPPWKGDYHHDLNTQMSYTSYLKANHLEEGESYIDYLISLSAVARQFASKFYGGKGLCLPSVMDIKGHALGGWAMYSLSPTNQLWMAYIIARHYHYSVDMKYLKERAFPYIKEVGEFIISILKIENDYFRLPLSSSPEIHDNTLKSWVTPNSNYDQAILLAFFNEMIVLSEAVNDTVSCLMWKEYITKLEPLAVGKDNVLMISKDEKLNESHRHHSHCMSIYPLRLLNYNKSADKLIIDSTIKDMEKLGQAQWVGYSLGWMAQLYITQGNGEKAQEMLTKFWENCCTANGFHTNGDMHKRMGWTMSYRYFTLEGNFLAVDALQEMLLYSENNEIKVFPSIPKDWKDVEFNNFRASGGLLISAKTVGGVMVYLKIEATVDACVTVLNNLEKLQDKNGKTLSNKIKLSTGQIIVLRLRS